MKTHVLAATLALFAVLSFDPTGVIQAFNQRGVLHGRVIVWTSAGGSIGTGGAAGGGGAAGTGTGGAATGGVAGAGTGGAAGGGGTGGGVGCGDGVRQDPESCDGSDLQSATCATLGFSGGTLSCSSSCQFDASSCTGGTLSPSVTLSRSSCVAPCAVFFVASGTTVSGGDYVGADFSWDFDKTGTNPGEPHVRTKGFIAAHTYDNPGTYTVSTRVRDLSGAAGWTTHTVTVSPFSPTTTYYVASSGNDSNSGTSMSTPFLTVTHAVTFAGTNKAVLLRRGDTFNIGTATISMANVTGPFLFGAYTDPGHVSAVAPIINTSGPPHSGGGGEVGDLANNSDFRMTDLHINSIAHTSKGWNLFTSTNTLFERVELSTFDDPDGAANYLIENTNTDTFFTDSSMHDFCGIGIYTDATDKIAVVGTSITNYTCFDHGIRFQGNREDLTGGPWLSQTNSYVADSTIVPLASGTAFDSLTYRGDNDGGVVVNNTFGRIVSFAPQNSVALEHIQNDLFEGNITTVNGTTMSVEPLNISGRHIYVRNNVINGGSPSITVQSSAGIPASWVDEVFVYNNTGYDYLSLDLGSWSSIFLRHNSTTGNVVVKNNIYSVGSLTASTMMVNGDGMGTETVSTNLIYDPNVTLNAGVEGPSGLRGDPKFVSNGSDFHLQSTSPARNAGLALPVRTDLRNVTRPKESALDIGAYEYAP